MTETEGALFEVLNAKKMSAAEIAASFVVPVQFDQLIGPDNSILVGPRGTGKTTLLRMLQGDTLMRWQHRRAEHYIGKIRYSTVFLPADRLWASQAMTVSRDSDENSRIINASLAAGAFGTQLLTALVEALQYRLGYFEDGLPIHLPAQLTHDDEVELVQECAVAWKLMLRTPTLNGVLNALDHRLGQVSGLLDGSNLLPVSASLLHSDPDLQWLELSPLGAFREGVRLFNRYTKQQHHRWALLLDEMELAPASVHHSLVQSLRGGDPDIVLKLSFSPFDRYVSAMSSVGGPAANNDFRAIYLWYGRRVGSRKFADGLWKSLAAEIVHSDHSAARVLGPSLADASGTDWLAEAYRPQSRKVRLLTDTAQHDPSYAEFLRRRKVDLSRISDLTYNARSATLRKTFPLVVFRDSMLDFSTTPPSKRSREKPAEAFTGVDSVYAALEGNPRWMKAVFTRLLSSYDGSNRISSGAQYDALRDAADRFESLLRVLPVEGGDGSVSVLNLVDTIGRYFQMRALGSFSSDFPLTFRVDDAVPFVVEATLRAALKAGAIVHLREKSSAPVLDSLKGERFRLAYLLCIRDGFELPLRMGKTITLSRLLSEAEDASIGLSRDPNTTIELFTLGDFNAVRG